MEKKLCMFIFMILMLVPISGNITVTAEGYSWHRHLVVLRSGEVPEKLHQSDLLGCFGEGH